jgi:hypothetical protein
LYVRYPVLIELRKKVVMANPARPSGPGLAILTSVTLKELLSGKENTDGSL